jgi:hypothetical protein
MPKVSKFWVEFAAGRRQLSPRWARKDARVALRDLAQLDELSEPAWMQFGDRTQRRLLRDAVAREVAT